MRSQADRSKMMRAGARRHTVFATRFLVSAAAALVLNAQQAAFQPAVAQEKSARFGTMRFDIPAQPLASALNAFGVQSGLQVSLAAATSHGAVSKTVKGNFTPREALSRLLEGTGTQHSITRDGTAIVTAKPSPPVAIDMAGDGSTTLEHVTVDGEETGDGDIAELHISTEELERKNPATIQDVFREEPSVKVGSSLPMSQKVYVHGIEETNLAISIDGSRQNNKVFHHNATTLVDPALLKTVSIDEGVASADAGPGALAGSIKYETKDVSDFLDGNGFGGFVTSSYNGNGGIFSNGISGYGKQDGLEFLGYFNLGRGENFSAGNGTEVPGTGTHFLSGIGKVAYEFESGDRVEISHETIRDAASRPYRANMGFTTGAKAWEPLAREYDLRRNNTVFTYTDTTPEGWWDPRFVLAYGSTAVETTVFQEAKPGIPGSYPISGETTSFNGKFENRFHLDIGTVTAGADFYSDEADVDDLYYSASEKARNVGAYTQARLEPFERARLSFGGRADHQQFTGLTGQKWSNSGLSGNVSAEYELLPDLLTAKAGYSHIWAGVPLAENFIISPKWVYPSTMDATTADNYTVGLAAAYGGFTLEGSVFRTEMDNARASRWREVFTARQVESEGFSIAAGYDWIDGHVRVKYVNIDTLIDGKPADSDTGTYLATPIGQIVTISAAHTFTDWGLTIGGDIEIAPKYGKVPAGSPSFKAYEVVNTFLEYKPPSHQNLTLRAEVKNLFNETYSDRATYGQDFGEVTPLYQPGRSFLLSLRAAF